METESTIPHGNIKRLAYFIEETPRVGCDNRMNFVNSIEEWIPYYLQASSA